MKAKNQLGAIAELRQRAFDNPERAPIGMEAENRPVAPPERSSVTQTTDEPERAAPAARKRVSSEPERVYPWESADPRIPKLFNLRFDEVTYQQLKYIGETTYGETMHSIAMAAVKRELAERLRALGVDAE